MTVTVCEYCDGTGWLEGKDDKGISRARRCACWQERLAKSAPGVPAEFRDSTLDTFRETNDNRHALKRGKGFATQLPTRDLYVFGPVGSGKTRFACALLNEHFLAMRTGYFARVPMLLLRLQPGEIEGSELFERCCAAPLLVLDDLGAERDVATDFTRRTLLMLYEERGDRGHRTIWTSNKSLGDIGDFMQDERLASRIAGRADVLELGGDDWRVSRRH